MIAVARLVPQVLDDGVGGRLLNDATGVATAAAKTGLFATAQNDGPGQTAARANQAESYG